MKSVTQFMLVISDRIQDIRNTYCSIDKADKFLQDIAHTLFTEEQLISCWYLERDATHDLFSQAKTQIFAGETIEQTKIGELLIKIFQSAQEVVFWYGNDFDNLSEFTNVKAAMNKISSELMQSSGEIYLIFRAGR